MLNKIKEFFPIKLQVVQGIKEVEVQVASTNFNKVAVAEKVRALMLPSPITEWEEGYNEAVEDAVNIIYQRWEWEKK